MGREKDRKYDITVFHSFHSLGLLFRLLSFGVAFSYFFLIFLLFLAQRKARERKNIKKERKNYNSKREDLEEEDRKVNEKE